MKNHLMKDVGIRTITQQPIPQPISRLRGPSSTGVEMPSIPSAFSSSAYSQRGDAYLSGWVSGRHYFLQGFLRTLERKGLARDATRHLHDLYHICGAKRCWHLCYHCLRPPISFYASRFALLQRPSCLVRHSGSHPHPLRLLPRHH